MTSTEGSAVVDAGAGGLNGVTSGATGGWELAATIPSLIRLSISDWRFVVSQVSEGGGIEELVSEVVGAAGSVVLVTICLFTCRGK